MNDKKILIGGDEYPIQFFLLTLTKKENNYEKIINSFNSNPLLWM